MRHHHVAIRRSIIFQQPSSVDEGTSFINHIVNEDCGSSGDVPYNSDGRLDFGNSLRNSARVVETEDLLGEGAGGWGRAPSVVTVLFTFVLFLNDT
jgi:hypothetical protein